MVHMRVGEQNRIDGWQVSDQDSRSTLTAQEDQPFRKYRIDQERATSAAEKE